MAKVKVSVGKLKVTLSKTFQRVINDPKFTEEIGQFSVDRIKAFTRRGKSIVTGDSFARLKKSSIENRKRLDVFNSVSEFFRLRKSNLTFTGQLVESLQHRVRRRGIRRRSVIEIKPRGQHFGVFQGLSIGKTVSNADLAKWMTKGDASRNRPPRPFIGMDDKGSGLIKKKTIRQVRRVFRTRFNRVKK